MKDAMKLHFGNVEPLLEFNPYEEQKFPNITEV